MRRRTRCLKAGLHVHESGYVLIQTMEWGPSGRGKRWEIATWKDADEGWGPTYGFEFTNSPLFLTLRDVVAYLESEIEDGRLRSTVRHPSDSPWLDQAPAATPEGGEDRG